MPYIKQTDRDLYEQELNQLVDKLVDTFSNDPTKIANNRAGHLNYLVTSLISRFYSKLNKKLGITRPLNYAEHNEIMGFLTCCAQEWYRVRSGRYEDVKIKENGDVD